MSAVPHQAQPTPPQRIAFFGGTFDPPHRGHLAVARAAAQRFHLDQVLFAPVARQPLKLDVPASSLLDRYAMVALATADDPRFLASQLDAAGDDHPYFTVDTIGRLRQELPSAKIFSLVGADAFHSIARWREPLRLLALCDFIVAARPGYTLATIAGALPPGLSSAPLPHPPGAPHTCDGLLLQHPDAQPTQVLLLTETEVDVSASGLRSALHRTPGAEHDVPELVANYIRKQRLYRN